jgi:4-carboxymuconolactone decarboxylase
LSEHRLSEHQDEHCESDVRGVGRRPEVADMTVDARHEYGMDVRRAVLGDRHVDAAIAATSELDAPFQEYITGAAWADVWGRPGLERPTRSLVTIALLAALGHERELDMHLRAAQRTGATAAQITEVLLHVGLYAGVPAANTAFAAFKRVFGDVADTHHGEEEVS